jgi:signal transduction histidine kinase
MTMLGDFSFNQPIVRWLNEQADHGIFTTDTSLTIRGWNQWLEKHSGRPASQVLGKHLFELFPEITARQLNLFYEGALEGQAQLLSNRFHGYLLSFLNPIATESEFMQQTTRIAPLITDGRVVGTITVIEDVSERLAYESELRTARDTAEAATKAKDDFIAMLSHDLRTPLNAIFGWARLLEKRELEPSKKQAALKAILRNASVQLQMIDDLLDVTRITAGNLKLEIEAVDIVTVVQEAVEPLQPSLEAKGIHLDQVMPAEGRIASIDPKRITQVVWNLVSNALHFTPSGGTVRVGLEFTEDHAVLKVIDTGSGISPEALPRVFEPMWQASSGSYHSGIGLGLSIVQSVVAQHGGTVQVESAGLGKGASFIVQLPLKLPFSTTDQMASVS